MNLKCEGESMSSISKSLSAQGGEALKPAFIEEGQKDPRVESHSKLALQQIEKANIPRDQNAGKQRNASTASATPVQIEADKIPPQETLEQILEKMPEEERDNFVRLSQIIQNVKDFDGFKSWKCYIDQLINHSILNEKNTEKDKLSRTNLRLLQGEIFDQSKGKSKSIELAILKVSPENRKKLLEIMDKVEHPHHCNESKANLIGLPPSHSGSNQPMSEILPDRSSGDQRKITNYTVPHPIFNGHASQQMIRNWKTYNKEEHGRINNKMCTNEDGYNCYFSEAQEIMPGIYLGSATVARNIMKPGSSLSENGLKKDLPNEKDLPRPAAVRCLDRDDEGDRKLGFFSSFFSRLFSREDKDILLVQVRDVPNKDDAEEFRMKFDKAFTFIDSQVNAGNQVLIHCRAGQSRSATLLAAYIMKKTGCTAAEALNWIATKRPIIYPQQPFLDLLHAYEKELRS